MAQKKIVLVDTDIFIKTFRGDKRHKKELDSLKGNIAISIITVLELYQGAITRKRKYELEKQLRAYHVLHLNEDISQIAHALTRKYVPQHSLLPPDCLIAATAIHHELRLYTDNTEDFSFIEPVSFYKPK